MQKGNNICSHRQTPHLLLLQKHWEIFQWTPFRGDTPHLHPCDIKHCATHRICDLQSQIGTSLAQTFNKCRLQLVPCK